MCLCVGLGGQTPDLFFLQGKRKVFIISFGLRNLKDCFVGGAVEGLHHYGVTHEVPPPELLLHAVRNSFERHAADMTVGWREGLFFDCRSLNESLEVIRAAPDYGHSGLHMANVAGLVKACSSKTLHRVICFR